MKITRILPLILLAVVTTACGTRIAPSFTGVKVNSWGTDQGGVTTVGRGWQPYNPITETIYEFPLHQIREEWTGEEAITVRSLDNATVTIPLSMTYRYEEPKVATLFVQYRRDADGLIDTFVRDRVRAHVNSVANKMNVMDILGPGISRLQTDAERLVQAEWDPRGVHITALSVLGRPIVDERVENSINDTLQAVNAANKAKQMVEVARNEAESARQRAQGQADATLIRARTEAEANKLIAESLANYGAAVIQQHAISKWNGVLPSVNAGGAVPFIQIPAAAK